MTTAPATTTRADDDSPFFRRGRYWGPWHLDRAQRALWTEAGGYRYEIDLDTCTSSAEVLDWICQINGKLWAGTQAEHNAIIAGLVDALTEVLHPQANLCSDGRGKRLSKPQIRYLIDQADDDEPVDGETYTCPECGATVSIFLGARDRGWQHYRGEGTAASPVEIYDAGHQATSATVVSS